MIKVFVYGSLMRGLHNSYLLAGSRLLNPSAQTQDAGFALVASGQIEEGSTYPYALAHTSARASDARVVLLGETYEVSPEVLRQVARAERTSTTLESFESPDKP